jgi:phosphoglycolate phosphatase
MLRIIWDLDGTVIDSEQEVLYHLELALYDFGIDMSDSIKPIRTGPTIDMILMEAFPHKIFTEKKLTDIISNFRRRYDNCDFYMTKDFNGIKEIIFDTKNFSHHIITNKPELATKRILEKLGWTDKIISISSPVPMKNKEQKKDLFSKVINKYGNGKRFIGIGDMKTDCIAANDNHIPAVGVLWGSGTLEELIDCSDYLFDDVMELHNFLSSYSRVD